MGSRGNGEYNKQQKFLNMFYHENNADEIIEKTGKWIQERKPEEISREDIFLWLDHVSALEEIKNADNQFLPVFVLACICHNNYKEEHLKLFLEYAAEYVLTQNNPQVYLNAYEKMCKEDSRLKDNAEFKKKLEVFRTHYDDCQNNRNSGTAVTEEINKENNPESKDSGNLFRKILGPGLAIGLAAGLIVGLAGGIVIGKTGLLSPTVQETATEAPVTEAPATEVPQTQPPATEAVSTEAVTNDEQATESASREESSEEDTDSKSSSAAESSAGSSAKSSVSDETKGSSGKNGPSEKKAPSEKPGPNGQSNL